MCEQIFLLPFLKVGTIFAAFIAEEFAKDFFGWDELSMGLRLIQIPYFCMWVLAQSTVLYECSYFKDGIVQDYLLF